MNLCLHLLLHVAELLVRVGELEEVDVAVEEVEVVGRRQQQQLLLLLLRRTEMEMMMNPLPHPALGVEVVDADVDADVVRQWKKIKKGTGKRIESPKRRL